MRAAADVVVIGGGVVGAAIGRELARRGLDTLIVEKGAFGEAVSGASLACLGTHMHALDELSQLSEACRLWADFAAEAAFDIEYRRSGQLRFILDAADIAVAEGWIAGERAAGLRPELLDPAAVRAVEPLLTGPILAASWSPDDATVNPFLAVRALLADGRRHGLRLLAGTRVIGFETGGGRVAAVLTETGRIEAGAVVLAAGPWTAGLAAHAGLDVPLRPRQAQCLASTRQPPSIRTVVGACESAGGVEVGYTQIQQAASGQILFNTVMAGGLSAPGAEEESREVPDGFVVDSIRMLRHLFPSLAGIDLLRSWVRFEAVSPDGRFLAGASGLDGLWLAAGDNGSGFCRAPLLARLIADEIAVSEGADAATRALYDPRRFERRAA